MMHGVTIKIVSHCQSFLPVITYLCLKSRHSKYHRQHRIPSS